MDYQKKQPIACTLKNSFSEELLKVLNICRNHMFMIKPAVFVLVLAMILVQDG
jgi:hypothetical protein